MVTIKDIAKKANVSIGTVSHVINKNRFVSDGVIKRVTDAMEELDYYPNLMAGSLRRKSTRTIGLIIPDISNLLFSALTKEIEKILFAANYNTIICSSEFDEKIELECLETLRMKMVDGLILIPVSFRSQYIDKIKKIKIPMVALDRMPDMDIDVVQNDNYSGGRQAAEHLIELGHKKIGFIDRFSDHSHSIDRRRGFLKVLRDNSIGIKEDFYIRAHGLDFKDGYRAINRILDKKDMPTAIFTINDTTALGSIKAIYDRNLKVPKDISIIGYDDIAICNFSSPRLTTIHYPQKDVSKFVCKKVLSRIEKGAEKKSSVKKFRPKLVVRESTCKVNL